MPSGGRSKSVSHEEPSRILLGNHSNYIYEIKLLVAIFPIFKSNSAGLLYLCRSGYKPHFEKRGGGLRLQNSNNTI